MVTTSREYAVCIYGASAVYVSESGLSEALRDWNDIFIEGKVDDIMPFSEIEKAYIKKLDSYDDYSITVKCLLLR